MDTSDRIAALERRLGEQQRSLDETRAELEQLRESTADGAAVSRRDWLRRAAVLSGATVAAGVAAAAPAAAADGDAIKAGEQTNETTGTVIFVQGTTVNHGAFTVTDTAFASMNAATLPGAITGYAGANTTGVSGVTGVGEAYGVFGLGSVCGVFGKALGANSIGVAALASGHGSTGASVSAVGTNSTGLATIGETALVARGAVHGIRTDGAKGDGLRATGRRGGVFKGTAAAVNLAPTKHSSHPHSGSAGDLYVDHHHRLWFCKGGTHWVQLA